MRPIYSHEREAIATAERVFRTPIDTTPDIRIVDGKTMYYYNIQQLEEISYQRSLKVAADNYKAATKSVFTATVEASL